MAKNKGCILGFLGKPEGKRPFGNPGVGGRIILKCIFMILDGRAWTGLIWLRIWTGVRLL
jgi:hypothetical protein